MMVKLAMLEGMYISGHISLREYTGAVSRLVLASCRKLERRDPFQRYYMPSTTKQEGITQADVNYFRNISLQELNEMLHSAGILKR